MTKIFYGWWIVLAALTINTLNGATAIYGLTLFIKPVVDEFRWSYLEVSSAIALTSVFIGVLSPVIGGLVDRFGSRNVVIASALVVGSSFVILSLTNSLAIFYLAFAIMAIGAGGIGTISLQAVVGNWFRKHMGLAMGIVSTGVGLGGIFLPAIAWLILTWDWRTASLVIGVAICIIMPPLALVLRQRPEDYGLHPDGEASSYQSQRTSTEMGIKRRVEGLSAGQALRTSTFWLLTIAYSIYFMGLNAVILHIAPYIQSLNLEPATAATLATALALVSNAGRVGYGFLGDRIPRKYAFAGTLMSQSLGLILVVLYAPASWALGLFVLVYGTGYGGSVALSSAMTREYFGGLAFGAIQGWFFAGTTAAGIIGPIFAGWTFDTYQSYNIAWLVFSLANLLGIASVLALKRRPETGSRLT